MSIEIPPDNGVGDAPELVLPTERQLKEQQDAQARLNERKAKARRKEESKKKAQNDRLVRDNNDLENDLQQTIAGAQDSMEKKIAKIRKKFEKKLTSARNEIDDLHQVLIRAGSPTVHWCLAVCLQYQEFEIEREEMLESIRESSKDTELFRQICLALIDEKKLRQVPYQHSAVTKWQR
jgi:signal recognition particle GTPase